MMLFVRPSPPPSYRTSPYSCGRLASPSLPPASVSVDSPRPCDKSCCGDDDGGGGGVIEDDFGIGPEVPRESTSAAARTGWISAVVLVSAVVGKVTAIC